MYSTSMLSPLPRGRSSLMTTYLQDLQMNNVHCCPMLQGCCAKLHCAAFCQSMTYVYIGYALCQSARRRSSDSPWNGRRHCGIASSPHAHQCYWLGHAGGHLRLYCSFICCTVYAKSRLEVMIMYTEETVYKCLTCCDHRITSCSKSRSLCT